MERDATHAAERAWIHAAAPDVTHVGDALRYAMPAQDGIHAAEQASARAAAPDEIPCAKLEPDETRFSVAESDAVPDLDGFLWARAPDAILFWAVPASFRDEILASLRGEIPALGAILCEVPYAPLAPARARGDSARFSFLDSSSLECVSLHEGSGELRDARLRRCGLFPAVSQPLACADVRHSLSRRSCDRHARPGCAAPEPAWARYGARSSLSALQVSVHDEFRSVRR